MPNTSLLPLLALLLTCCSPALAQDVKPASWAFDVLLDGKPIGKHRFNLQSSPSQAGALTLISNAQYEVKFLGISFYKYAHKATERWQGGCLQSLESETSDDGKPTRVQAARQGAEFVLQVKKADQDKTDKITGCAMSFAYWNPDIRKQTQLINPQSGVVETVSMQPMGSVRYTLSGQPIDAQQWKLQTTGGPILLWYGPAGEWIGLEATVAGQRKLEYRLP